MKRWTISASLLSALGIAVALTVPSQATEPDRVESVVVESVKPLMQRYGVPGMAVGIVVDGHEAVFNFGVASKQTGRPVDDRTLFELGSVSKTFTATLAAYAAVTGHLSLDDKVGADLPALKGSAFDTVSLLDLGTHTPGGMPLQFPDDVTTDDTMMRYFREWKPTYAPGTVRTYANPSIGLLGLIAARRLHGSFDDLMAQEVFRPLGLWHSFLSVPASEADHSAQGYTTKDVPIRMSPGMLASEAYGVRTTAADVLRFVQASMDPTGLPQDLERAITLTHTGFFAIGAMTQDLIWEQYRTPVALQDLQAGNSAKVSAEPNPATRLEPPLPPQPDVLVNKTGSTNGFAAYVAMVPGRRSGLVLLANKNYPIAARVETAFTILTRLLPDIGRP
jgi:beta-lactamase class C